MDQADSLADLLSNVHATLDSWGVSEADTDVWFRGVSHRRHKLLPRVYRPSCRGLDPNNLLYRFQTHGASLFSQRPDPWEWYFTAQHHGLPTRLLDWTDNLYTAVYFALESFLVETSLKVVVKSAASPRSILGDLKNPPTVWVLDAAHMNKITVGERAVLVPGGELTDLWAPETVKRNRPRTGRVGRRRLSNRPPIALLPARTTPRIIAQQGVFTIHGAGDLPLDSYYGRQRGQRLKAISINPKRAYSVWRDLHLCGIHRFSVFPDLASLATHVRLSCS